MGWGKRKEKRGICWTNGVMGEELLWNLCSPRGLHLPPSYTSYFPLKILDFFENSGRLFLEERVLAVCRFLYFGVLFELNLHGYCPWKKR